MQKAVVLCHYMKAHSVLFQRTFVQPVIALQESIGQMQALFIFSWCWKGSNFIPEQDQLFQTGGCCYHVLFTFFHSFSKGSLDDRGEGWQEMPSLTSLAIQDWVLGPWLLVVTEHRQLEICHSVLAPLLRILDLDLAEKNCQPFPRFLGSSLLWPLIVAAVMKY